MQLRLRRRRRRRPPCAERRRAIRPYQYGRAIHRPTQSGEWAGEGSEFRRLAQSVGGCEPRLAAEVTEGGGGGYVMATGTVFKRFRRNLSAVAAEGDKC